ncbi:unknown protein [Microcystis aeruginosa NIES-843]|uniref:Uncharacterized protein n=1 Tax=Microcystis aeruginosa (strain NIES-843 / IAM M-2473) TaxID=449447 RepID=B0JS26_MICAN|nr:unknown protein [Microcystis aeruginosa NIES-843]
MTLRVVPQNPALSAIVTKCLPMRVRKLLVLVPIVPNLINNLPKNIIFPSPF